MVSARTALVALLAVAAGCLGDDGAPSAAAPRPLAPTPTPEASAPEGAADVETGPQELALHAEATLRTAAAVCPPMVRTHCVEPLGAAAYGEEAWTEGFVQGLRATVEWTASSTLTQTLELWLGVCWGAPEAYECETLLVAEGPSPLSAEAAPTRADAGYYYVVVTTASTGATPDARASTEQPFVLDGVVTLAPPT